MQERMERLMELAELPECLRKVDTSYITPGVQNICSNMFTTTGIIYLHGIGVGKSTNAAALLMSYLHGYSDGFSMENVGLYVSTYDLCFHNTNRSRYQQDPWIIEHMERMRTCKCLVVDDVFTNLAQQEDILLNTIVSMRQYFNGVTVFVSSAINAFDSASRVLQRIERSAKYKEEFM